MKNFILLLFVLLAFTACKQSSESNTSETAAVVDSATAPIMSFEKESYDFGQITEGERVAYDFYFTNTGKTPLIITSAAATCGCTVPEYPREAVEPGQKGHIHVVFNSTGKSGMQNKVVTLTANTYTGTQELHLIGDVKPKNN
ncbi:MAG: DUF1573 domain-containing protein [Sphingobacteriaceae bacterium]